jgi:cytochrome c biogenesis protein ResB
LAARLDTAVSTLAGSDAAALANAEASLRGARQVALVDSYGYNAGYLQQILQGSKPTNAQAPALAEVIRFTDTGVFDATYPGVELKHLQRWRNMARPAGASWRSEIDRIINGAGATDALGSVQAAGAARGRFTWTLPFLSITNWDQPSYDSLIATSVSFLQAIQETGLAALAAAARGRSDWARQSIWSNALLGPFGGSYSVGFGDPTYDAVPLDDALPKFTFA